MVSLSSNLVLMVVLAVTTATPVRNLEDSRSNKYNQDIRERLQILKSKLQKLDKSSVDDGIPKEHYAHARTELMRSDPDDSVTEEIPERPVLEKFLRNLTPEGMKVLKDFKEIIKQEQEGEHKRKYAELTKKSSTDAKMDTFFDNALSEAEEGVVDVDGATSLNTGSDVTSDKDWKQQIDEQLSKGEQLVQNYKPGDYIPAKNEEGYLVDLRGKIKEAVEKNLLSDIALAVHSGIPVQEILDDFQFSEDRRRRLSRM